MNKKLLLLSVLTLFSCNSSEEIISGLWVVDRAYLNNKPAYWDLYTNSFSLKPDHTCVLPINDWNHRGTNKQDGTWELIQNDTSRYLKITTENTLFNRTFKITKFKKISDPVSLGTLLTMTLSSDSLKLDCTSSY